MSTLHSPQRPAQDFLEILWDSYTGPGWLNLWTYPCKTTYNFESANGFEDIDDTVMELIGQQKSIYFQIGLQVSNTGPHSRGREETTCAIPGFWLDVDIHGPGHCQMKLPNDLNAAQALIAEFILEPTLIVHSGGGIYPFWLFKEPWVFTSSKDRNAAKDLSVRFQSHINGLGRQRGYKLDSTGNLDRLLRIPGSMNLKIPDNPRPVRIIRYNNENRYNPEDIKCALHSGSLTIPIQAMKSQIEQSSSKAPAKARSFPLSDFDKIKAACAWVHHCVSEAKSLPEPEWYAVLSLVACCENGQAKAHEISAPYPGYTKEETERKLMDAQTNAGPRTCDNIRNSCNGEMFCASCQQWGKVTSPIQLGQSRELGSLQVSVAAAIPDAPMPISAMVPSFYNISYEQGVFRSKESDNAKGLIPIRVCPIPVIIISRHTDINMHTEYVELAWFKDNHWILHVTERRTIADTHEILQLSNYGLPVTSLTSRELILYLEEFEIANGNDIAHEKRSSHLGWQDDTHFLCGETLLVPSGATETDILSFRAQDDGDSQIAKAFTPSGIYQDWLNMANSLYGFPKVFTVVMASLAAPFLRVLGAANFIVDIAGETSKGKTTAQVLAASGWGNPNQRTQHSVVHSWSATEVWFERTAALLTSLPLILDDTKTSKSQEIITKWTYDFASGKGRGRGSLAGTRGTGTWQTIMISSGEQSIGDYSASHGGAQARVLNLWGSPFGDGKQGQLVKQLEMLAKGNYGHAGPTVVQFILDHYDDWPLWQTAYSEMLRHFSEKAAGNNVAIRLSEIFALFAVAIPLIHAALPGLAPSRPISEILDELWPAVAQGAEQADIATEALKTLWEWAVANQTKFWGRHKCDNNGIPCEPSQGWAGRWDHPGSWTYLAVPLSTLTHVLRGFEVRAIVKYWVGRGWIDKPNDRKGYMKSVRIGSAPCDAYSIPRTVLAKVLGLDLADSDKHPAEDEALR